MIARGTMSDRFILSQTGRKQSHSLPAQVQVTAGALSLSRRAMSARILLTAAWAHSGSGSECPPPHLLRATVPDSVFAAILVRLCVAQHVHIRVLYSRFACSHSSTPKQIKPLIKLLVTHELSLWTPRNSFKRNLYTAAGILLSFTSFLLTLLWTEMRQHPATILACCVSG